jgi:hypothetical protein
MSEYSTLVINDTNSIPNGNYFNKYRYEFPQPTFFKKGSKIAMSNIQIPYSFFNVMNFYNNNKFTLKIPTATGLVIENITIPDGNYSILSFNNIINQTLITLGYALYNDKTKVYNQYISLSANVNNYQNYFTFNKIPNVIPTDFKIVNSSIGWGIRGYPITGNSNYITITLNNDNNIGKLIGFSPGSYPTIVNNLDVIYSLSNQLVNLSVVNTILINTNIIDNKYSLNSRILTSFSPNVSFSYNINIQSQYPIFVDIKEGTYSYIDIEFLDQNGILVPMNDKNICLLLIIQIPN